MIELHTQKYDFKLKTNNHTIKYKYNHYGIIKLFIEFESECFCLIEKFEEIEKKNILERLQKKNVSDILHANFYEIFKFMKIKSNVYELITLDEINNMCISAPLEDITYITECVEYDNFD